MDFGKKFDERRSALEEEFFARENQRLLEKLRRKKSHQEQKKALAEVSGITDDLVLEALIQNNIGSETLAAVSLVPLIAVAWADGHLHRKERQAVLDAARKHGLKQDTASFELLENWLKHEPSPRLLKVWKEYVGSLPKNQKQALRDQVIGLARTVAGAAGGFLGLISAVSTHEKQVLEELESVFG